MFKIDIRWHDDDRNGEMAQRLTDKTRTPDPVLAEKAYRSLLGRDDLIGQLCAARLVSPIIGRAIYFSRFDRDYGRGRIHPDAPLDLSRLDDGTAEATMWRPPKLDIDFSLPFPELLKTWAASHNWNAQQISDILKTPRPTYRSWIQGQRGCPHEDMVREYIRMYETIRSSNE
jgi:hypothetical protein